MILLTQGTKDERDHIVCIEKKQNQRRDLRTGEEDEEEEGTKDERDHIVCIEKNKIRGGT
jgi:hypothetical protein